jgi:hypothetical protein
VEGRNARVAVTRQECPQAMRKLMTFLAVFCATSISLKSPEGAGRPNPTGGC